MLGEMWGNERRYWGEEIGGGLGNWAWGNGRKEMGRRGKMKGWEKVLRWKRRRDPYRKNDKRDASFHQTTLFICFSSFILPAECWHSPARLVREVPCCVSCLCLTRGIMGVEVHSIQERAVLWWRNVAVCCWGLPASWKHISGLSSARFLLDQSGPLPALAYLHIPVVFLRHTPSTNQKKNKIGPTFPACMIRLNQAASLRCPVSYM